MGKGNKKIGIIGHFGGDKLFFDGQTIKTKILYNELLNVSDWEIVKVDTYYKNNNPLKLLKDTLMCLNSTHIIIVLLSENGMKFYFPLLAFYAKMFNVRIFHDVIGGSLDSYVEKFPKFKKYLTMFQVNWVETNSMKKKLSRQGINNCEVIPNFKRLKITDFENKIFQEPYQFCCFSRVMKEKGIETAIEAIEAINAEKGKIICELDIFGCIDKEYKETFSNLMKRVSSAVRYKGMVNYNQSVETIKDYYALLFPTYWAGEGFPGTIIDAFSAGLPVIGTDWNCNGEIIENKWNGLLYPNDEEKNLKEAIEWSIAHKEEMVEMKRNCIFSAKKYQPDEYIKKIIKRIEIEFK